MRRGLHTVLLALGLCMAAGRAGVGDSVVAPGASVAKLAGGFEFTEGPTCSRPAMQRATSSSPTSPTTAS